MCRHLAYVGRPRTLAELALAPPYGLLRQSYAPRRQLHGTVNADGFGAGWYDPSRPVPARYRRAGPIWADPSFTSLAGVVCSGAVLAAVRSATAGTPADESACAPFLLGQVLLSHNGRVDVARLGPEVASTGLAEVGSTVDSAFLAAMVAARLAAGDPLPAALADVVRRAAELDPAARLNLLATDGSTVAATAWGDTLVTRADGDGVLVASEPGDDGPGWEVVADRSMVVATRDEVRREPL